MRTVYCKKCHIPVKSYFIYCPNCGARLDADNRILKFLLVVLSILLVSGIGLWMAFKPGGPQTSHRAALEEGIPAASSSSKRPLDFFSVFKTSARENPSDVRLRVGRVVFYDIADNPIAESAAAASESGWVAIPQARCIGAKRWVFKPSSEEEFEIFGGVIGDYDDMGLWQFRTGPTTAPPIFPADLELPMTWMSLDMDHRADLHGASVLDEQQNVDRILLKEFPKGPGVFLQNKKIVGWTFEDLADGYLWKGVNEENRVYEVGVSDFYRLTFAGGREEQFIIAYAENDNNLKDQLAAFAIGFSREPMLSPNNTPAHLTSAAAVEKMRGIISQLVSRGELFPIVSIIDASMLSAAGDLDLLADMAVFTDQVSGPESVVDLIDEVMARPEHFDQTRTEQVQTLQKQFYIKWLNQLVGRGNYGEGSAAYQRAARLFADTPEIHLIGARLALAHNDWATAQAILRGHFFPAEFTDQVRLLENQTAELKSMANRIVIRFSPGSALIPVTAKVNNRLAIDFIVDTGASMVTIPSAAAEELGIRLDSDAPMEELITAGGRVLGRRVHLTSITIGGWTEYDIPGYILDLPDRSGLGLLGLNYLNRFRMDLNTRAGMLTLAPR